MKAVRIHSFGDADVMHLEEIETPRPGRGEVLVRVVAASVNPVDYKIRSGEFKMPGANIPLTLGRDISGVVEALGEGVSNVTRGNSVIALLDAAHGGYAEFVVVRSADLAPKPGTLDHVHAAAVPLAAITAWQGLFDHGTLKSGERVLIHGASGGVGHFAVQFAHSRGATVFATARDQDRTMLEELGAIEVIDYRRHKFENRLRDIDLVFDLVGGEIQNRSWNVLKKGGRIVSALQPPSEAEAAKHDATGVRFMAEPNGQQLTRISRLIDNGDIRVIVQRAMPLSEVRSAHETLENEHIQGKLVLEVA